MRFIFRILLIVSLVFGLTGNDGAISSATLDKSDILTDQENLELCRIINASGIQRIDSLISAYKQNGRFNGNILVALNGFNVYQTSAGYADPLNKIPARPETIYQLASVSKQFTAAAIMILKADGKLDFDDLLIRHIPELPYPEVTIRQLLHHTGGLPNYMYLTDRYWKSDLPPDNEDVVELMAKYRLPAFFKPGSRYDYSNTGYMLLATVVQRVSGMSLNAFLQLRIFGPLGMTSTYVFSTADSLVSRRQADGFRATRHGYSRITDTRNNGPVGDKGVCSSVGDMFKWDCALYTDSPISQELIQEAFTPVETTGGKEVQYGYGFRIRYAGETRVIYHNGLWEGARTNFMRYPDHRNTIIVLNNTSTRINHELTRQIEAIILGNDEAEVTDLITRKAIEEGADQAIETYNELLENENMAAVNFDVVDSIISYLDKSGKKEKALQLKQVSVVCRELAGI